MISWIYHCRQFFVNLSFCQCTPSHAHGIFHGSVKANFTTSSVLTIQQTSTSARWKSGHVEQIPSADNHHYTSHIKLQAEKKTNLVRSNRRAYQGLSLMGSQMIPATKLIGHHDTPSNQKTF